MSIPLPTAAPPAVLTLGARRIPLLSTARVYVCGVTPYDVTHLGHAATFVWVDALAAVLRDAGTHVEVCRNITDIDDVLDAAADRLGADHLRFPYVQQYAFDHDLAALRVARPQHEPRARHHVDQVVALTAGLLATDAAYVRGATVYFRGAGVLEASGLDRAEALARMAEFRDEPDDPAKDDPADVALWRSAREAEPAWDSPWGVGRPGWHAQCAAMLLTTFGPAIDLHAGGHDLHFPHHAYETAMAEAFTGTRPLARGWMHVGTVSYGGRKMAKSTGNLVLVSDLLRTHSPAAVRLHLLDRPWASGWEHTAGELDASADRLAQLHLAAGRTGSPGGAEAVRAALHRDLDIPSALDVAIETGGEAARLLADILRISPD